MSNKIKSYIKNFKELDTKKKISIAAISLIFGLLFLVLMSSSNNNKQIISNQIKELQDTALISTENKYNQQQKVIVEDDVYATLDTIAKSQKKILIELKHLNETKVTAQEVQSIILSTKNTDMSFETLQQMFNENEKNISKDINKLQVKISELQKQVSIRISDNPLTVVNNDFSVLSIVWVNGSQLVNIHINKTNSNKPVNLGQEIGDWKLISVAGPCAVFQNSVGVNKQCI